MKIDDVCHGKVKILSGNGKVIVSGRGVFVKKEKVIYATFRNNNIIPIKIERGYHIAFIMDNKQMVLLSIGGYDSYIMDFLFESRNEQKFNFYSYIKCKTERQAKDLLLRGIDGVKVYLSGIHSGCVAKIASNYDEISVETAGKRQTIIDKKFDDNMRIIVESTFGYNGKKMEVNNILAISISGIKLVEIALYKQLLEAIELYWNFYCKDIEFNIKKLEVITDSSHDNRLRNFTLIAQDKVHRSLNTNQRLIIDKIDLNVDVLHNIVVVYTGNSKRQRQLKYGFSQYLNYIRSKTIKVNTAILMAAAALDSITNAIVVGHKYSSNDKNRFKKEITEIQKIIGKYKDSFCDDIYKFYCETKPEDVLQSLTRRNRKDALNDVVSQLSIKNDTGLKAACEVIDARDKIMHGKDAYEIDYMIEDFIGYDTLRHEGDGSCIFGYDSGHIYMANMLIRDIGSIYFKI